MSCMKIILYLAVTAYTADAFTNVLLPASKEAIYTWKASIKIGTQSPAPYANRFALKGKIHLQSNNNVTHAQIRDLKFKIYNGPFDQVQEKQSQSVPLPDEAKDLLSPFKIVYDDEGLVDGISTETDEKEFSRNIKKSIASILQVNNSIANTQYVTGLAVKENSLHGYSNFAYDVRPSGDAIKVHKFHEMASTDELYRYYFSNLEPGFCDVGPEQILTRNGITLYLIVKQSGQYIAKNIVSSGSIIYYPFRAKSDYHLVSTYQELDLVEVAPVETLIQVESERYEDSLTYHPFGKSEDGSIADITNGRLVVLPDKLIPIVRKLLEEASQWQEDLIREERDDKNTKHINIIQNILQKLPKDKLEEVHKTLSDDSLELFHQVLPLVGTEASTLYIKHLIVNKVVKDDIAVRLLELIPDYISTPTLDLLSKLEELIHLSDDFHWNVRKAAILSFGNIIHKSDSFTANLERRSPTKKSKNPELPDPNRRQPYEKYILEFITKLKTSEDYKTQITYIFALINTKQPSLKHHMLPGFNGQWWTDQHLRFLSMIAGATGVMVDLDPNAIIETLWPIFVNREELTEMRIVAYCYIMEARPSYSRLWNIFIMMATEPNKEVYHFHYTYLQAVMHSKSSCKSGFRLKLAQLMKLSPPPSHGLSSAHVHDYEDVFSGFGERMLSFLIKTNQSMVYCLNHGTQDFNNFYERDQVFLKVHDGVDRKSFAPFVDIPEALTGGKNFEDVHIEAAIVKRGNIVNCYYFDQDNLGELRGLIDHYTKDSLVVDKDYLNVDYYIYQTALIPSDLGIPVLWEFFMPEVHRNRLTYKKEVVDNEAKAHIDNRFVKSDYYQHGLNIYNPIINVRQGIHRVHVYDLVLPLHFDFVISPRYYKISWTKHSHPHMDVAGMRCYVQQEVFVKGYYNENVLTQSSPNSKEVYVVTKGKQYRHDYHLIEKDDLNTGHKFQIGLFDSEVNIPFGYFSNQIHHFVQPYSKHFTSPLEYILLNAANFERFGLFCPIPGNYGFLVKLEPSQEHVVSNIDVIIRTRDERSDISYFYGPADVNNVHITYDVRNREESLKSWDANVTWETNPGHTVNGLKLELTRTVPGQGSFKICAEGVKKWAKDQVTGHLSIEMGQTCVGNGTVIDVTMTGEKSLEQKQGNRCYEACEYVIPDGEPYYHTLNCLIAHTTVRHYVYNVKATNVPSEFKECLAQLWDHFKSHHESHFYYRDVPNKDICDTCLEVDVEYVQQPRMVNIEIASSQRLQSLSGVPSEHWAWFGLYPDSLAYSRSFYIAHAVGKVDHCLIQPDRYVLNGHTVRAAVPNEWTLYVGDDPHEPTVAVYVKLLANSTIGVKAVHNEHSIEIAPQGADYQIILDGKVVPTEEQHQEDWIYYHVFVQEFNKPIAVMLQHSGFHLEYDGHQVTVVPPGQLEGRCYSGH